MHAVEGISDFRAKERQRKLEIAQELLNLIDRLAEITKKLAELRGGVEHIPYTFAERWVLAGEPPDSNPWAHLHEALTDGLASVHQELQHYKDGGPTFPTGILALRLHVKQEIERYRAMENKPLSLREHQGSLEHALKTITWE
jgi:hypothetical protein